MNGSTNVSNRGCDTRISDRIIPQGRTNRCFRPRRSENQKLFIVLQILAPLATAVSLAHIDGQGNQSCKEDATQSNEDSCRDVSARVRKKILANRFASSKCT